MRFSPAYVVIRINAWTCAIAVETAPTLLRFGFDTPWGRIVAVESVRRNLSPRARVFMDFLAGNPGALQEW